MKKKKKPTDNLLLTLFGSMSPKCSSIQKDWEEIRGESREQYVFQRVSSKVDKSIENKYEKGRE